jgi:ABC-2 type transport system ATP-binding protein
MLIGARGDPEGASGSERRPAGGADQVDGRNCRAFDGSLRELRERAREAEYQLRTDDDERALEVCRRIEGIRDARLASRAITFDARERHVELLSRALGASGIGIRSLVAPTSALETVFFRLTDHAEDGHLDAVREPVVGAGTQESVS